MLHIFRYFVSTVLETLKSQTCLLITREITQTSYLNTHKPRNITKSQIVIGVGLNLSSYAFNEN